MASYYTISLKPQRHKRKIWTQMIVTSNAVDGEVKPITWHPGLAWICVLLLCIVIGGGFGYLYYERQTFADYQATIEDQARLIHALEEEKEALSGENSILNDRVQILSTTVTSKTAAEQELAQTLESQALPTELPLSSSATMEEAEGDDPILLFAASEGSAVIAAASGRVVKVESDEEYGTNVWIDHENGYVTIYRNKGTAMVKEGDLVSGGNTLFIVTKENMRLGYQIQYDGAYIDPMEVMAISG